MSLIQKVSDGVCSVQEKARRSRIWDLQRSERISFFIGLGIALIMIILAIFADFLAPYSPFEIYEDAVHEPPSWAHLMGTDAIGRDVLSRVIHGARVSLLIGLLAVLISGGLGSILGVVTGYYGGKIDRAITLPMDALYSFPAFLTALLIVTTLGGGFIYTSLAVAIGLLPRFYRTVRSAAVSLREEPFVEAEVSIGASDIYIVFKHIFPLTFTVLFVVVTISIATAILSIAGLGFLGLGVAPPTPEWGSDLAAGRPNILSGVWWTTIGPAIFIFLTVLGFNLLGEGLNKLFGATLEEI
jgi:peptide/nickel transport system permease protein